MNAVRGGTVGSTRLLFLYAALVPLVIIPLPIGQSIGAADLLFPFALWVLLKRTGTRISGLTLTFTLFVIASLTSTALFLLQGSFLDGTGPVDAILIIRMYAVYMPLLIAVGWEQYSERCARKLIVVVMVSGSIACLIGVVMYYLGVQVRDQQQTNWYGNGIASTLRAGGILGNSGDFGHIAAIVGTVALTFGVVYLRRSWLSLAVFLVAAYATYLSSSRAAMLHIAVALLIMLPVYLSGRRVLIAIGGAAGLAILAIAVLPSLMASPQVDFAVRRLDVLNLTGRSLFFSSDARLSSWSEIGQLIQHHPFFGIGYSMMVPRTGGAGDNSFLTLLVETGLLSGVLFALVWVALVFRSAALPRGNRRTVALAVTISEIAHMLTIDTHRMWATAPLALLVVGLALRGGRTAGKDGVAASSALLPHSGRDSFARLRLTAPVDARQDTERRI